MNITICSLNLEQATVDALASGVFRTMSVQYSGVCVKEPDLNGCRD